MSNSLIIALVEDHERIRVSTAVFLRKHGHVVFELECVEEMDEVVGGAQVDLFILDLNLPGEDGLDFTSRLRSIHPHVGVIIMTARGGTDHIARGYQNGADIYLVKPVASEVLIGAIESIRRRIITWHQKNGEMFNLELASLTLEGPIGKVLLNQAEAAVLVGLMRSPQRTLDIYQVSTLMGQSGFGFNQASLVVRIVRLRKKLISVGADSNSIKTQRAMGYQLRITIEIT